MSPRSSLPLSLLVVICLTLGLVLFTPEPHFLDKFKMLIEGEEVRPIDILDLALLATPWVLLDFKLYLITLVKARDQKV